MTKTDRALQKHFIIFLRKVRERAPVVFEEVYRTLEKLNVSKGEDYNGGKVSFLDYFPEGLRDLQLCLHGKVTRLKSLVSDGRRPNHDSTIDNGIDLAAYALWFAAVARYFEKERKKCRSRSSR